MSHYGRTWWACENAHKCWFSCIAYIHLCASPSALLCMWDGFVVYVISEREIRLNNNTGAEGMSFFIFLHLHSLLGEAAFTNTHSTHVHISQSWGNWIERLRCPSNKLTRALCFSKRGMRLHALLWDDGWVCASVFVRDGLD